MKNIVTSLLATLLATLLLLGTVAAQAQTIRRVNNTGITGTNIYADIDAAITASAAGDIIQVEPSGTTYPSFTLNKTVTIVGPGYFLDPSQNAGLQANPLTATTTTMSVQTGGANASVTGLTLNSVNNYVSNFTIQRCSIGTFYINYANAPLTNINIKQCYIGSINQVYSTPVDNILITNCIITSSVNFPTNFNGGFFNNVVLGGISIANFFVTNNYFASGIPNATSNTLANNISASASFPTTNGNQAGVPQNAVFVLAPGATAFDAWYQLKAGTNPARGTGAGGTDIGIFSTYSTNAPYKLGGLPNIPAIYQQSQTITGNSLNGTLSTRSNN